MINLIQEGARNAKACIVYVTHDADEASQIAERVVTLRDGHLDEAR